jgi:multiple sugar transport system permease protein
MTTVTSATELGKTEAADSPPGGPASPVKKPRRTALGYVFIAPAVLYLVAFILYPLIRGVQLSFTDTKLVNPDGGDYVGLDNYAALLDSGHFWNSLGATLIYTAATVVLTLCIGTAAAVLVNRPFRGRAIVRAIMTFPYATPAVAAALIFIWIYNQSSGILNRSAEVLGIGQVGWLTDPQYGMLSVVIATAWKVFPFVMLIMLAALQSVPEELFEAARVDGADGLSTFRAIMLPHLMPTLRIVALLMTIWSIRRFEIIYLLTGGGPVETTNTLVINIYRHAFSSQELGMAAAIGVLGLVLSLAIAAVFVLVERREERKEGAS